MAVKLRLARWGAKKKPYYHIVAADARSPRDGKFLETVGKYNPMLEHDNDQRVTLKNERIQYWLKNGAIPTDKVHKLLAKAGLLKAKEYGAQTKKDKPKAKALAKLQEQADAKAKAEESKAATTEENVVADTEVKEEIAEQKE